MPIQILRCTTGEPRFQALVRELDMDLTARYGAVQELYSPHNTVAEIETAVLALEEGTPVGCGCFKLHGPETIELKRMFVRREVRGRRIGQQLVHALEEWARELGHAAVVLETGNLQHEAIALYTRCGYQSTPCFPPYDQLPASVCMRKPL